MYYTKQSLTRLVIHNIVKKCHELQNKCLFILPRNSAVIGVYVLGWVFYAVQGSLKDK